MWAVVVLHVTLWGPVIELGRLAETDNFASCIYLSTLAIEANRSIDLEREHLILCKWIEV